MKYEKLLYNKKKKIFSIDNNIYIRLKNGVSSVFLPLIRILLINFGYDSNLNTNKLAHIIINKLCNIINTTKIKSDFVSYDDTNYIMLSDKTLISDEFIILVYQYKWDIHIMQMVLFNVHDDDDDGEYEDFIDINRHSTPSIYFMNVNYEVIRSKEQ
jgi:hypothetical protein